MAARQANDEDFSFWTGYLEGRPRVGPRSTRKPATFNGLRGPQSSFFLFFTETGRKSPKSSHFWVPPVPPFYTGTGTRSRSKWDSSRTRWNTHSGHRSSYSEPQNQVFTESDVWNPHSGPFFGIARKALTDALGFTLGATSGKKMCVRTHRLHPDAPGAWDALDAPWQRTYRSQRKTHRQCEFGCSSPRHHAPERRSPWHLLTGRSVAGHFRSGRTVSGHFPSGRTVLGHFPSGRTVSGHFPSGRSCVRAFSFWT